MERFFEFLLNHYALTGAFFVLAVAFALNEIARGGKSISPQGLSQLVNRDNAILIDIRDVAEFRAGHITGSQNIPYSKFDDHIAQLKKEPEHPIVVICNMGQTAGAAGQKLKAAGMTHVYKLDGGISNWKGQSLPLVRKS
jgi:rhodanese-related sulfurtransferase